MRQCYGEVEVSFYEGDYDNVTSNKSVKTNKVSQNKSLIHYMKPQHERIFVKVEIPRESKIEEALISVNPFNDKSQLGSSYTEISFREKESGNLKIDLEHMEISFDTIQIRSTHFNGFKHRVDYILYLSES